MIFNSSTLDFGSLSRGDIAVVGGGAVGIIAALDLAQRGHSVTLLDAGPPFIDAGSQYYFENARSIGKAHAGLHNGRFRALGGTTNFWGGQLVRLDSIVFEHRPWVDELSVWPIRLSDIERYYRRCEDMLQIPTELRSDEKVFELADVPKQREGGELAYFLTRWLTEKNFRVRFMRDLKSLPNLTVVTDATVVALQMDAAGTSIVGVRVRTQDGKSADISCRACVLANGTIEIARLMLHKLADGRTPVWAANRWLGRGFMDHLEGAIGEVKPRQEKLFRALFDNIYVKGMKFQPRLRVKPEAQRDKRLLNFAVHMKYNASQREHFDNAKIFFAGLLRGRFDGPVSKMPSHLLSAVRVGAPMMWHYIVNRRIFTPKGSGIELRIMVEQQQVWDSTIALTGDVDALGMNIVALDWRVARTKEMETVRTAAEMAKAYLEAHDMAEVEIADSVTDPASEWIDAAVDTFHHMGATRMAESEGLGVVDSDCRVFGTDNLFIAGASVFPSAGFGNPTFTAMALTLRLCDHLSGTLKDG